MIDDQGWCGDEDFDDPLRAGVKAELSNGETLIWTDRPAPPRMRRVRVVPLVFVASLTALSGLSLAAMLGVLHQRVVTPERAALALGLAPFAIGGLIVLDVAFRAFRWFGRRMTLARTVYAMTDQRVIIGRYDPREDALHAYSVLPGMIAGTSPYEYADGSGDLYFEGLEQISRGPVGFFGIRSVRSVDRLLRETLIDPFPRW